MSLEGRIARIEKDVAYLRGVVEQMDKRLSRLENEVSHLRSEISSLREDVEKRISSLRNEMSNRFDSLRNEIRELRTRIWWIVGILLSMWITIILTILFK